MEVSNSDKNNNPTIISVLGPLSSQVMSGQKMSHKTWRGVLKKLKRKLKRRKAAEQEEQENPSCNGDASEDDAVKQHIQDKEMQLQLVEHARWLQREKKAHEDWLKKKWLEEQEKKRQEEQDRRIKEEWEESQRKEKEEKEKLEAEEQKKKEEQVMWEEWIALIWISWIKPHLMNSLNEILFENSYCLIYLTLVCPS